MHILTGSSDTFDPVAQAQRLVSIRWWALATMAALVAFSPEVLDIPLPRWTMLGVLGVAGILNGIAHRQASRCKTSGSGELFSQILIDIATLAALVFLSGGATNPLVSLLLPPVALAALTLPARKVAAICGISIAAYSLLMVYYLPLAVGDASRATRLHLVGMWLTFAVSAAMIAWLVVRMMQLIRERDAALATVREKASRDERVTAIGTLAAGAAHELGTPLATMSLIAGELATLPTLSAEAQNDIALLHQQIGVCKGIITGLSRRAGAERLESTPLERLDQWVDRLRLHWHARRPQVTCHLLIDDNTRAAPMLTTDPRLEQALLNLLNNAANAANAGDQPIEIRLDWSHQPLSIAVRDYGPGFPQAVLEHGGKQSFSAHDGGNGIGLILTRSAIEQLGGRLVLSNPAEGGALARIELPLDAR